MKKTLFILFLLCVVSKIRAQEPQRSSYPLDDLSTTTIDNQEEPNPLALASSTFRYAVLLEPTVSVWLDKKHKKKLENPCPFFFGLVTDYPINKYLTAGFTLNGVLLTSEIEKDPQTGEETTLKGFLMELYGLIRPRLPITFSNKQSLILYSNLELGLATLTGGPIQFYTGHKMQRIPAAGLGTSLTGGIEYLFNSWTSLCLEGGIKYTMLIHLLEYPEKKILKGAINKSELEKRTFFSHDLISFPISIGLKFFI
jgi:hypothetical protein